MSSRSLSHHHTRRQRMRELAGLLQALTADGLPVPLDLIAARAGLRSTDAASALHDLEDRPGSGPLFIDGGYV